MSAQENTGFTEKAIRKVQSLSITDPFAVAITAYLVNFGRIAFDPARDLFWVTVPSGPPQVAVWMMPVVEN